MDKKHNRNAGRQAHDTRTPREFRKVAAPGAGPSGDPVPWVCLLQTVGGNALRIRVGTRSFRLSSDTVFFLEEIDAVSGSESAAPVDGAGSDGEHGLFTYVCGTPEAVVRTIEDLRRSQGRQPVRADSGDVLRLLAN